ncbi:MAG: hypothetical protein LBE08_12300 [Bifidobacteriaceae bacterium]|jgi:alpha-glucosidase|nr:hypothetical protein [Bifidobacteriaceae bacterium]
MVATVWLGQPHHDGSALYVDGRNHHLGDRVAVRLMIPAAWGESAVKLWVMRDGEPLRLPARITAQPGPGPVTSQEASARWYEAILPVDNPEVRYRWLIARPGGYHWVTARGVFDRDVPAAGDFLLTTHGPPPAWSDHAVGYQIFPDRFARSGRLTARPPTWARAAEWDATPAPGGEAAGREYFGGDLYGIAQHADYLADLGISLVYLTPFFPAGSTHRYDASTFDWVDPLLGGDQALIELSDALHRRGIRLIGDLTVNHTGSGHEWFRRALAARSGKVPPNEEQGFYYWPENSPLDLGLWQQALDAQASGSDHPASPDPTGSDHPASSDPTGPDPTAGAQPALIRPAPDYLAWLGIPTLPKLNWNAAALIQRMITGPDSVVGRYLRPPFNLDGWRIDVAHMTGRFADDDLYHQVARTIRATMDAVKPDSLLIGEHFFDVSRDLPGDGWHAVMNYAAFLKPVWSFLASATADPAIGFLDVPLPVPRRDGGRVVATMREFAATAAWPATSHAWNMLDSHDSARIATIAEDPQLVELGAAWLATYPGIPAIFAGAEGGARGATGEASRTTMPWDQIAAGGGSRWSGRLAAAYRALIALRRRHTPLRTGGLRWAFTSDDAVGYLRETPSATILVALARAPWAGVVMPGIGAAGSSLYHPHLAAALSLEVTPEGWRIAGDGPGIGIWRIQAQESGE